METMTHFALGLGAGIGIGLAVGAVVYFATKRTRGAPSGRRAAAREGKPTTNEWFEAVKDYRVEDVRSMLAAGMDANAVNTVNQTALLMAVSVRHRRMTEALLEGGADPNWKFEGRTPLLKFAKGKERFDADIIGMLKDAGATE